MSIFCKILIFIILKRRCKIFMMVVTALFMVATQHIKIFNTNHRKPQFKIRLFLKDSNSPNFSRLLKLLMIMDCNIFLGESDKL